MHPYMRGFNVPKPKRNVAHKYLAVIAAVIAAGIVIIAAIAPANQSNDGFGSAQASDAADNSGNGSTGYFPNQFGRPVGAIEPQSETF
jgi:hypothetical protein